MPIPILPGQWKNCANAKRLQIDILEEFNSRLADHGIKPISSSAFSRHSIRLATLARRIEDTRAITSVLTKRLEPGDTDNLTILVAETIKTLVLEMLLSGGDAGFNPKQAKEMAEALRAAASAQKVSADRRVSIEKELAKKVEKVTETIGKEAGLDTQTIAKLRREFLGVREQ